jgi:hypothetical protein
VGREVELKLEVPASAVDKVARHCQLKPPWYALRIGGGAARVGELFCLPIVLPALKPSGAEKGALGPLS